MPAPLLCPRPGRGTVDARLQAVREGRLIAGPETLQVNLGNRCNLGCIFCWNHSPLKQTPPPAWHDRRLGDPHLGNVIASLPALGPDRVVVSGMGEPFLHPRAVDLLAALQQQSIPAAIQTNGTAGLEPERIVDLGVDHLAVNVSAATREGYERTHPGQGGLFSKLVGRLERIASLRTPAGRPRITIVAVIQATNEGEIAAIPDLAASVGADGVELKGMEMSEGLEPLALGERERLGIRERIPEIRSRALDLGLALHDAHLVQILASGTPSFTGSLEHGPCYMGWYYLRVASDGRVMFCCKDKLVGHLDERSLYRTWRSPAYHLERLAARDGDASTGLLGGKCRACSNFERNAQVGGSLAACP